MCTDTQYPSAIFCQGRTIKHFVHSFHLFSCVSRYIYDRLKLRDQPFLLISNHKIYRCTCQLGLARAKKGRCE